MGRAPCCDKANVKKGSWSPEEDALLKDYIEKNGTGANWIALPQKAGLRRCGKSCRLRWLNYLRPNIRHGEFSDQEDRIICTLFSSIGSRWSVIAAQLPGRTDNDIKNYWNTKLKKKLIMAAMAPSTNYRIRPHQASCNNQLLLQHTSTNMAAPPPFSTYKITTPNITFSRDDRTIMPSFTTDHGISSRVSNEITTPLAAVTQQDEYMGMSMIMNTGHDQVLIKDGTKGNNSNNFLFFGGEASCSTATTSSDGSCISSSMNNISHGVVDEENLRFQSYFSNGVGRDQVQGQDHEKFLTSSNTNYINGYSSSSTAAAAAANHEDVALDYNGIEEIKQLISSTNYMTNVGNNDLNFFVDDYDTIVKTEQNVVLDY